MAEDDEYYMRLALKEAQRAYAEDEVPVGAVLTAADGSVLAATHNTSEHGLHALAHAETVAMSIGAISLEQKRLWDCTLYVTLEPCTMCAAALSMMRIKRLVYGAANPKGGAVENGVKFFESAACNHRPEIVAGVLADECGALLTAFFQEKGRRTAPGQKNVAICPARCKLVSIQICLCLLLTGETFRRPLLRRGGKVSAFGVC